MSPEDGPVDIGGKVPFFGQVSHSKSGNLEVRHDPTISEQEDCDGTNVNGDIRPKKNERAEEITECDSLKYARNPDRVQVVVRKPIQEQPQSEDNQCALQNLCHERGAFLPLVQPPA